MIYLDRSSFALLLSSRGFKKDRVTSVGYKCLEAKVEGLM